MIAKSPSADPFCQTTGKRPTQCLLLRRSKDLVVPTKTWARWAPELEVPRAGKQTLNFESRHDIFCFSLTHEKQNMYGIRDQQEWARMQDWNIGKLCRSAKWCFLTGILKRCLYSMSSSSLTFTKAPIITRLANTEESRYGLVENMKCHVTRHTDGLQ